VNLKLPRERTIALAGVALLTASYASVLYHVTDVVGMGSSMLVLVAGTLALATLVGRYIRLPVALTVTATILVGGAAVYYLALPESQRALLTTSRIVGDSVALLTGLSILRLTAAGVWALSVTPGPVFLSWYLAVRGRYVWSVAVGGVGLGVVVLTGDVGAVRTLLGVVGGVVAVGVGGGPVLSAVASGAGGSREEASVDEARRAQLETLAAVVSGAVFVAGTWSVVPGSAATPLLPKRSSSTVEASLVEAKDDIDVLGSITLSPKVRFTVEADEPHRWQTAVYDRFTGDGWIRTGETVPYDGDLPWPPGPSRSVEQRVDVRTSLGALPAAWKPASLDDDTAENALRTPQGGIRPRTSLASGMQYTVTSRVPEYTESRLQEAGTDYPDAVRALYLQLPDSTTERVRQRAADVTADATTPYQAASVVESYLKSAKGYSLDVERPDGNTADAFLFEMEEGYCVYFATAMTVMLRSVGVPARFVVGYTAGEEADGKYVVRGFDSHAWVQVYFPGVGWVDFDPTPAGPRRQAETARLSQARADGESGVDTSETMPAEEDIIDSSATDVNATPVANGTEEPTTTTPEGGNVTAIGFTDPEATTQSGGGGFTLSDLPDRETLALWAVAVVGAVAGARRTGVTEQAYRQWWLRHQTPGDDPGTDVRRAFARVERLLSQRRPRRAGETPRAYVEDVGRDERVRRVLAAYEAAEFGDGVDRPTADGAVEAANSFVREHTLPGRLFE
jgi:transglutaminase-like putative cysteine protease